MTSSDPRYGDDEPRVDQAILGEPITLPFSGKVAKTRFMKAAMTERLSSWDQHDPTKRGTPSKTLNQLYEAWGKDAFGIILSGNLLVSPIDLEAPGNMVLSRDTMSEEKLEAFREQVKLAKANGSLYIAQLSHGGRQVASIVRETPVSASDVKLDDRMGLSFGKPEPLSREGIRNVIDQFAFAAEQCHAVGFDGIELHCAHGYLLSQFLSPTTNLRTDEYGGSLENRSRILFEIYDEIKKRVKDDSFSLSIKMNSVEFQDKGFSSEDAVLVAEKLEQAGVDFIELSGGTYEQLGFKKRESTVKREAYFLDFANMIRPKLQKTKVFVTGGFRSGRAMVEAVQEKATDGVGLGRPVASDFTLCADLISNKVAGAKQALIDENDFGTGNVFAGTAMAQKGRRERTFDLNSKPDVEKFSQHVQEFFKKQGEEMSKGIVSAGYPEIKA
ncbi:NADH-dependent flavin oxidoreductase [Savitreella phatthalungensis]